MSNKQKEFDDLHSCPYCGWESNIRYWIECGDGFYGCQECDYQYNPQLDIHRLGNDQKQENVMSTDNGLTGMELHMSDLLESTQKRYESISQEIVKSLTKNLNASDTKEFNVLVGRAQELALLIPLMQKYMRDI